MTLSRDASVAGDRVSAENYLQHAEHYLRIVAAGQAQVEEQAARAAQHNAANGSQQPEVRNGDGRGRDGGSGRPPRKGKPDRPARASGEEHSNVTAIAGDQTAKDPAATETSPAQGEVAASGDDKPEAAVVGDVQDA